MKKFYLSALGVFACFLSFSQSFTNSNTLLPNDYNSGGCLGVVDMDNDGFDDIILLDNSNELKVLYQTENGFDEMGYGTVSGASQWGMAIGDCNNDGHADVFCGGSYDGVRIVNISEPGVYTQNELNNGSMFMQGANLMDIDADGDLDAFGCHDDATERIWVNDGGSIAIAEPIPLEDYDFSADPNTDHSGNYGSVWTDFDGDGDVDLFIAKCRQGVNNPQDPRRVNQLWVNGGDGTWTEEAMDRGLVVFEQSWTADFVDYDNDGDFDCFLTNHSETMMLLENDGGYFTDVTDAANLAVPGFFLQAKFAD
ncbi:MAG: VCBS repeat-containing protein, partial [Bacteroidota bacterium]